MKSKYLIFGGIVVIAATFFYLKFRKGQNVVKPILTPEAVNGEKHIREVMKKSKPSTI